MIINLVFNYILIMAKVKYFARENTRMGRHSFYAVPLPNGTLEFNELCIEACENTSIEPTLMKSAVSLFMAVVQRNLLKGHRTQLGEDFITLYPNISVSVKDEVDEHGNVIKEATAKMLTAAHAKSTLGATVHPKFSAEFASKVSWQKVDEKSGIAVEDDIVDDNNNGQGGGGTVTPPDDGGGF